MKLYQGGALAALAFVLSGCATVINGTSQDFVIKTDPEGVKATLINGMECTTPCDIQLRRKDDLRIDLVKDGYKPTYVLVQSRTGGTVAGNILLGGIVGGVVDASNGASNHLYPEPVNVRLAKVGSSEEAVLLTKDGEVQQTVAGHNNTVKVDVAKTIGADAAGLSAGPAAGGAQ